MKRPLLMFVIIFSLAFVTHINNALADNTNKMSETELRERIEELESLADDLAETLELFIDPNSCNSNKNNICDVHGFDVLTRECPQFKAKEILTSWRIYKKKNDKKLPPLMINGSIKSSFFIENELRYPTHYGLFKLNLFTSKS